MVNLSECRATSARLLRARVGRHAQKHADWSATDSMFRHSTWMLAGVASNSEMRRLALQHQNINVTQ